MILPRKVSISPSDKALVHQHGIIQTKACLGDAQSMLRRTGACPSLDLTRGRAYAHVAPQLGICRAYGACSHCSAACKYMHALHQGGVIGTCIPRGQAVRAHKVGLEGKLKY